MFLTAILLSVWDWMIPALKGERQFFYMRCASDSGLLIPVPQLLNKLIYLHKTETSIANKTEITLHEYTLILLEYSLIMHEYTLIMHEYTLIICMNTPSLCMNIPSFCMNIPSFCTFRDSWCKPLWNRFVTARGWMLRQKHSKRKSRSGTAKWERVYCALWRSSLLYFFTSDEACLQFFAGTRR